MGQGRCTSQASISGYHTTSFVGGPALEITANHLGTTIDSTSSATPGSVGHPHKAIHLSHGTVVSARGIVTTAAFTSIWDHQEYPDSRVHRGIQVCSITSEQGTQSDSDWKATTKTAATQIEAIKGIEDPNNNCLGIQKITKAAPPITYRERLHTNNKWSFSGPKRTCK